MKDWEPFWIGDMLHSVRIDKDLIAVSCGGEGRFAYTKKHAAEVEMTPTYWVSVTWKETSQSFEYNEDKEARDKMFQKICEALEAMYEG